jgi:murein L,D-transpeptidase YcbB/YkuD
MIVNVTVLTTVVILSESCHHSPPSSDVAATVEDLDTRMVTDLNTFVNYLGDHGRVGVPEGDSVTLEEPAALAIFYRQRGFRPAWSDTGHLLPSGDSLMGEIARSADDGLSPAWYHSESLSRLLKQIRHDSTARKDAVKWSITDLLLTDAFMHLASSLRFGVLPPDSVSLKKDSTFTDSTLVAMLSRAVAGKTVSATIDSLRPAFPAYTDLSRALHRYRARMAGRDWDTLPAPGPDSAAFRRALALRLVEGGMLDSANAGDSRRVQAAVKAFQREYNLYPDGVAGGRTIRALDRSPAYRIGQMAVNLERWRHRSDSMPDQYVWVNIPAYSLQVHDSDSVVLHSRVIVGKPGHQTPLLNSRLVNFQLYPYWRVPFSIITHEMLPRIRKDTGYLTRNNLEVVDRHNNVVDPRKLNWKKYNEHYFPYLIRQMTGLDNSLGIIKFNFLNKYSVYLHDTNLRNLFGLTQRDLSHGCVRVQQWQPLAMYLIRDDTLRHMPDSVALWMMQQKQKLVVLRTRVPLYIRYFTCSADAKGNLTFYQDIYGYDTLEMKRIFGSLPQTTKL